MSSERGGFDRLARRLESSEEPVLCCWSCATRDRLHAGAAASDREAEADSVWRCNNLPPDRSVLADLYTTSDGFKVGEGSRVVIAAYVLEAHVANTSKGESVNCKHKGVAWNDIHVALGKTPHDELCESVTAEVSPHFRPDGWTASALEHFDGYPYRITGHLFFDASHTPCKNGKGSPRRKSNWEIHPVYAIDVCVNKSLASCDVRDDSKWQPLHEAVEFEDDE